MPLVSTADILSAAMAGEYSVGAFTAVDYLTMEAIVRAAEARAAPVVVQTCPQAVKRFGVEVLAEMAGEIAGDSVVPVALHLDHGTDPGVIGDAIRTGYGSVMVDWAGCGFDAAAARTKSIAAEAHGRGVGVEGIVGLVPDAPDEPRGEAVYATPDRAVRFVEQTGADFLAVAVGTAHGLHKTEPRVRPEVLRSVRELTPVPLVVHGVSSLGFQTVRALVSAGATKLNVTTRIKQTYLDSLYEYIARHRDEYDVSGAFRHARQALMEIVGGYIAILGCAGKA